MIVSAAYTAPMPIMKATAPPMKPLTRMERRVSNGSSENHPIPALIRPMKLSRRSGRSGSVSGTAWRPAFRRSLRALSLLGTLSR
jgi:hypothetical protein